MKAYELIKETFCRHIFILIVHLSWFAVYGLFFIVFEPYNWGFQMFLYIWGGCLLPLILSTGIFGNDIASGRICVLVTKPLWPGELYIYRLTGLSLQGALHLILAGCGIFIVHIFTGIGNIDNLSLWVLSSWLLFNTWAAMSTSLSVVVKRAYNCMFLAVAIITINILASILSYSHSGDTVTKVFMALLKYAGPPFEFLSELAKGNFSLIKSAACVTHTLMLTVFYGIIGIIILSKRQFICERD